MKYASQKYAYTRGYNLGRGVAAHIAVAEKAFGGRLPLGSVVHHWDGDGKNNTPSNLLVCPSESYHKLIHLRMRALEACGNANWLCCSYCQAFAQKEDLVESRKAGRIAAQYYHAVCRSARRKVIYHRKKEL